MRALIAYEESVSTYGGGIANHSTDILGIAEAIDGSKEPGARECEQGFQGTGRGNLTQAQDALVHGKTDEILEHLLVRDEQIDGLSPLGQEVCVDVLPFGRDEHGTDREGGFQQSPHHLFALGDKVAGAEMIKLGPHRPIGSKTRVLELQDVVEGKHSNPREGGCRGKDA